METSAKAGQDDVSGEVNKRFLESLAEKKVPAPVIERLRNLLLADKKPSRKALSDALFAEDPLP